METEKQILWVIRDTIEELYPNKKLPHRPSPYLELQRGMGFDSYGLTLLRSALENAFSIRISTSCFLSVKTLGMLTSLIKKILKEEREQ